MRSYSGDHGEHYDGPGRGAEGCRGVVAGLFFLLLAAGIGMVLLGLVSLARGCGR